MLTKSVRCTTMKMSERRTPMRTRIDVRVPVKMYDSINMYMQEHGLSRADAVRELLADSISRYGRLSQEEKEQLIRGTKKYDN